MNEKISNIWANVTEQNKRRILFFALTYFAYFYWIAPIFEMKFGLLPGFNKDFSHFYIIMFTIFVGTVLDRGLVVESVRELIKAELKENSDYNFDRTKSQLIPMIREFGISEVHGKIDFKAIVDSLKSGDYIDILFTFHPIIDNCLSAILAKVKDENVQCRMLLGSPDSEAVKRRFSYIQTSEGIAWNTDDMPNRLKTFFEETVPNQIKLNRNFERGKDFQLKSFNYLPDIPLIIISEYDDLTKMRVKRVLQGYYLNKPAMELPFVEWVSVVEGDADAESMALLISAYFESRWSRGTDLSCVNRQGT